VVSLSDYEWLTERDKERSATVSGIPYLLKALQPVREKRIVRLLDIGCGFGGLTRLVGEHLGIDELHGIDIDERILEEALGKGVQARRVDVQKETLPYADGFFDLVISLGMIDYLPTFDPLVREVNRVLAPGGHALASLPNLASWHNRLALLLGYQPRDVEISDSLLAGVLPSYRGDVPSGHIHTATTKAFIQLMEFHGFSTVRISSGSWQTRRRNAVLVAMDRILSKRATLARRFFYLGRKVSRASMEEARAGWWQTRKRT